MRRIWGSLRGRNSETSDKPHRRGTSKDGAVEHNPYISVRHVYKHESMFEVDADFLNKLRSEDARDKSMRIVSQNLMDDPFFNEDNDDLEHPGADDDDESASSESGDPAESRTSVRKSHRRHLTWCSEPWDNDEGEERDALEVPEFDSEFPGPAEPPMLPPRKSDSSTASPPIPPRTKSTFVRLSSMLGAMRPGRTHVPPTLPPRPMVFPHGVVDSSTGASSERLFGFDPLEEALTPDSPAHPIHEIDSTGTVPLVSEIRSVKRNSGMLETRRRSDFSPPLFHDMDNFKRESESRGSGLGLPQRLTSRRSSGPVADYDPSPSTEPEGYAPPPFFDELEEEQEEHESEDAYPPFSDEWVPDNQKPTFSSEFGDSEGWIPDSQKPAFSTGFQDSYDVPPPYESEQEWAEEEEQQQEEEELVSPPAPAAGLTGTSALLAEINARRQSYSSSSRSSKKQSVRRSVRKAERELSRVASVRPPIKSSMEEVKILPDPGNVDLSTYKMMLKAGLPEGAVYQKMTIDGVDPALLGLEF